VNISDSQYLLRIKLLKDKIPSFKHYPFSLNVVQQLEDIEFHPKVTFVIGENGSGKSTILEAIAAAYGFNPEGGTKNFSFSTRSSHSELYKHIRLIKSYRRAKDGFFLRAESYFNVATEIEEMDKIPSAAPLVINSYGGKPLHEQSHGEAFFSLMMNRFGGNGVYILDEPEAALSPIRQIDMLNRINQLVNKNSQFIITTHSPIILSYPNSTIYELTSQGIFQTAYEDTEHYSVTKDFLMNHELFLNNLFDTE